MNWVNNTRKYRKNVKNEYKSNFLEIIYRQMVKFEISNYQCS